MSPIRTCGVLAYAVLILQLGQLGLAEAKPVLGPPSRAVTADILDAVVEEMNRSMTKLQIPGAPKPYHISYKITEVEVNDAAASLGATTSRRQRHFVNLEARVRVGSPDFDNGNFVLASDDGIDGVAGINLPLEATPRIARRAAWLATDSAYKEALIQLRAKADARKAGGVGRTDTPSWTSHAPTVNEEPVLVPRLESLAEIEDRAKKISATFRDQRHIRDSRVAFTSYLERRWYLSTEGTSITDTRRASGLLIAASSQAEDNQAINQYFLRYGHTADDLPGDAELTAAAGKLSSLLAAQRKAPVIDAYSGPVLFEGEGAVGILRSTLAPHLGGTPLPEGLPPQQAKQFGGALSDKVGLRVLAPMLSVVDDPTTATGANKALIGGYRIDDEGTPAQRVQVVRDGKLETLLQSRTPSGKGAVTNGHARRTAEGGAFRGSATNLFVTGRGGVPRKALVGKLLAAAKSEGLPYGLIIRAFDDPAITAAPERSRRELLQLVKSSDPDLPPPALLAYRVYPNGREELVRGVQLAEVPIRAWKDVIGTSKEVTVFNFLSANEQWLELVVRGTDDGFVPSGGIESAIITPDLLFRGVDVIPTTAGQMPPPAIPSPLEK
ncbi:MAG: metallopeptidase TldD-related protein [Kofleriaceae bacterium]